MNDEFKSDLAYETFLSFRRDIYAIFKNRISSIVVYGSSIRGDFIEGKSDIDFIVFVNGKITKEEILRLLNYHKNTRISPLLLKKHIEGKYIALDKEDKMINGYYVGTNHEGWKEIDELGFSAVESAMIIDSYNEYGNSRNLEMVMEVDWEKIETEIIYTLSDFIGNSNDDIGWIAYALLTSIRSFYTVKEVGFISKRGAVEWIRKLPKYSKYTKINDLLFQYTDHFSSKDKEKVRKSDFGFYKTYLIEIKNDIERIISSN